MRVSIIKLYFSRGEIMINYNKLLKKLEENNITTYTIRKNALMPQSTLTKLKMCSSAKEGDEAFKEINEKLDKYKETHNGTEFKTDVSTKTIEDICQLLQCQPQDIMEWQVELNPELSYSNKYGNED